MCFPNYAGYIFIGKIMIAFFESGDTYHLFKAVILPLLNRVLGIL